VRIERIRVDGFGRLEGLDTGPSPLGGLVVVLGPNEAGKSTLFHFLTTALYGFQPASRERNPHVPWGADEAGGSVQLRLDGSGCVDLERRLRSQPTGRLTLEGRRKDLRNHPVSWVQHVPRSVFRQVFAITLGELAGLDDETWARIQDRVVGSMGASDLRSAREVAEGLEQEAAELWRPNRRGNQRVRAVQEDIRALRARRASALERDRRIRALIEERETARARAAALREERQRERLAVERVQSLLPVHRQLQRITTLRAEGGPRDELRDLPADAPRRLTDLESESAELRSRAESVVQELAEPQATLARFGDAAKRLLARRDEITDFLAEAAAVESDRVRARELEREIAEVDAGLQTAAEPLLSSRWTDVPLGALTSIPVGLLRQRVLVLEEARRGAAMQVAPGRVGAAGAAGPWAALGASGGLGAAGALAAWSRLAALLLTAGAPLLVWGLANGRLTATALGSGLAAIGGTIVLVRWRVGRAAGPAGGGDPRDPGAADLRRDTLALLRELPLLAEHLESPGERMVSCLERIQELAVRHRDRSAALAAARVRDRVARRLAGALGLDSTPDARTLAPALDRQLRAAERLEEAAAGAEREAAKLRREQASIESRSEVLAGGLRALTELGRRLGRGDVAAGLESGAARRAAHERADQIEEELERGHPDLDQLRARITSLESSRQPWAEDDGDLAARRARIEALDDEIEDLTRRAEALDRDAAHLRELETVDAVDGEIVSLQEEEARLVRERDRKWVLAQLVREADRRFRAEHQPDLVQRAGSYLAHLTGGRYDRLVIDERAPGGLFQLLGPGLPAPIPLARPVSTGTLEQAYLSLRLAIVDHLDQGGERLPLFIDEVFVNWDPERRARGLEVLADLSATRQLFVFTCHPDVAQDLGRRGGRILRLEQET